MSIHHAFFFNRVQYVQKERSGGDEHTELRGRRNVSVREENKKPAGLQQRNGRRQSENFMPSWRQVGGYRRREVH